MAAIKKRQNAGRRAISKQWDGPWVARHGHEKQLLAQLNINVDERLSGE
jgi:hypothetical protein